MKPYCSQCGSFKIHYPESSQMPVAQEAMLRIDVPAQVKEKAVHDKLVELGWMPPDDNSAVVAWRRRAIFRTDPNGRGEWIYSNGADKPAVNSVLDCEFQPLFAASQMPSSHDAPFEKAWYEISNLLIGNYAQAVSPKEVHDNQVMPRLRALREMEAVSAQDASPKDGWQPIESAPKDGTLILLGHVDPYWPMRCRRWHEDHWRGHDGIEATHWRPLPEPPK